MSTVHFVGGLLGDSLDTLTVAGHAALMRAERVIFPGDWLGPSVRELLESRLLWGRHLDLDTVLQAVTSVDASAILYGGDPSLFSGRFESFPTARVLDTLLQQAGVRTVWHPGISSVNWALTAARMEVLAGDPAGLHVSAAFARPNASQLFLAADDGQSTLALLWFEDHVAEVWAALLRSRGADTAAHLVRGGPGRAHRVSSGSLRTLMERFPSVDAPAVLLVEPRALAEPDGWSMEAARSLLEETEEPLVWITGLPGSGKSTLLRALQAVRPDIRSLELASLLAMSATPGPPAVGGLRRNARAADYLRAEIAECRSSMRWFVASAGLSAAALGPRAGERVVLLDVPAETCRVRLEARPAREGWSASADDLTHHAALVSGLRACAHVRILRPEHPCTACPGTALHSSDGDS